MPVRYAEINFALILSRYVGNVRRMHSTVISKNTVQYNSQMDNSISDSSNLNVPNF